MQASELSEKSENAKKAALHPKELIVYKGNDLATPLNAIRLCSHEIDKSVEICYTIKKTEVFFDGRAFGGVSPA
jgi:hypothetical protein